MKGYKSFAVTVQGRDHVRNGSPCQDASDHYNDDSSNVYIAVVADGHGDSSCFRSDIGAKFAAECAIEGIKLFVKDSIKSFASNAIKKIDSIPEPPSYIEFEKRIREKLIKQMVLSWNIKVEDHHNKEPFKPEELESIREKYRLKYEKKEDINKAYGTTLIAAVITPWYWFAFHIGDGRFSVLYPDGTGDQPVFWDERCFLNSTTSICDDDILEREQINPKTSQKEPVGVRCFFSFINEDSQPPIAFFLCTDGIDDNYPVGDNEIHLYRLYRAIAVGFAEKGYKYNCGEDGKSGSLEHLAMRFATEGKGDDTSIAGIVNIEELKKVASTWKDNMKKAEDDRAEAKKIAEEEAAKKAKEEELQIIEKEFNKEAKEAKNAAERAVAEAEKVVQNLVKEDNINEIDFKNIIETSAAVLTNANNLANSAKSAAQRAEQIVSSNFGSDRNSTIIQDTLTRASDDVEKAIKSVRDAHDKIRVFVDNFNKRKPDANIIPPISETVTDDGGNVSNTEKPTYKDDTKEITTEGKVEDSEESISKNKQAATLTSAYNKPVDSEKRLDIVSIIF